MQLKHSSGAILHSRRTRNVCRRAFPEEQTKKLASARESAMGGIIGISNESDVPRLV
jgi:hypothetical protein